MEQDHLHRQEWSEEKNNAFVLVMRCAGRENTRIFSFNVFFSLVTGVPLIMYTMVPYTINTTTVCVCLTRIDSSGISARRRKQT